MKAFLVGGAVRDALLGLPVRERDWVVVGETPESMIARGFRPVGKDFPVFLHPVTQEEYALARTERKTGHGYKGFVAAEYRPSDAAISTNVPPLRRLDVPCQMTRLGALLGDDRYVVAARNALAEVEFTHEGELCSFDAFLRRFRLKDPALDELARIVRGADTGHPELAPQSAGLLAVSLGLSQNFADDHQMLEHGMVVYDALYAWCKRGKAEVHTWNPDLYK